MPYLRHLPPGYDPGMMGDALNTDDPLTLLTRLCPAAVRERLNAIEAERRGLLTLLRSLRAREREAARRREADHA